MSDYDAFGRKKDEAGLGDLGWGTSDDPDAPSGPHRTVGTTASEGGLSSSTEGGLSSPTEFTSVPTGPPPMRRRRGRNPIAVLVQLLVLGGIAFAIYLTVDAGKDTVDKVQGAIEEFNGGFQNGGPGNGNGNGGDDTVPEQVAARKFFTAEGLRGALKIMERETPGEITNISIRRDFISYQVVDKGERSVVTFNADAEIPEVITTSEASVVTDTLSYEEINPTAPPRLMRAANARTGQSPADVDYFIVSKAFGGGEVTWNIYYEGGSPIAQGDSRGRYTRRIS